MEIKEDKDMRVDVDLGQGVSLVVKREGSVSSIQKLVNDKAHLMKNDPNEFLFFAYRWFKREGYKVKLFPTKTMKWHDRLGFRFWFFVLEFLYSVWELL